MSGNVDRVVEKARARASFYEPALADSTIVVAGAGGYLGDGLLRALSAIANETGVALRVVALAREGEVVREHSLRIERMSYEEFERSGLEVDYCINTIGMTGDFRSRLLDTADAHICMLVRLLRSAVYAKAFVNISSTRVYPFTSDSNRVWTEEDEILTAHLTLDAVYDDSKKLAETLCHSLSKQGVPCKVVRMSNIVSEDLPLHGALAVSALFGALRERGEVLVNGNAAAAKDFCHLADAVDGVLSTAVAGRVGGIYNVGSGVSATTMQVAQWVAAESGAPVVMGSSFVSEPALYSRISIQRARAELGFDPQTDVRQIFASVTRAVMATRPAAE